MDIKKLGKFIEEIELPFYKCSAHKYSGINELFDGLVKNFIESKKNEVKITEDNIVERPKTNEVKAAEDKKVNLTGNKKVKITGKNNDAEKSRKNGFKAAWKGDNSDGNNNCCAENNKCLIM